MALKLEITISLTALTQLLFGKPLLNHYCALCLQIGLLSLIGGVPN